VVAGKETVHSSFKARAPLVCVKVTVAVVVPVLVPAAVKVTVPHEVDDGVMVGLRPNPGNTRTILSLLSSSR